MSENTNAPTVGSIYSRFFHLLGQDFGLILRLGIVAGVIPSVALAFLSITVMRIYRTSAFDTLFDDALALGIFVKYAIFAIVFLPLGIMIAAWNISQLSDLALARDNGLKPRFMPILMSGLGTLFPVLTLGLIIGLAVTLGLCLGVIPGVIAGLALGLAVPVYVCEAELGIWGALKRSIELTRTHRWTIFLVSFAAFIVQYGFNSATHVDDIPHDLIWPVLLQEARNSLIYGFAALLTPVIYLCLRDAETQSI